MKTTMMMLLLLACSAALMCSADASPTKRIPHQAFKQRSDIATDIDALLKTIPKEMKESFVEDIANLTIEPNKCKAEFFCKVEVILANHTANYTANQTDDQKDNQAAVEKMMKINKSIHLLNKGQGACVNQEKMDMEPTENKMEFQKLLEHLNVCLRYCNTLPGHKH